eukprot:4028996-Amphidinium_carterae.1
MMVSLSDGGRNVRKQSLLGRRHHAKPEKTKNRQQIELRNENLSSELIASRTRPKLDQISPLFSGLAGSFRMHLLNAA